MAESTYPTTQALAGSFIISAGCILFRIRDNYTPTSHSLSVNVHVNAGNDQKAASSTSVYDDDAVDDAVDDEDRTMALVESEEKETTVVPTQADELQVCILHHLKRDEWLLPKGRKDRGESIEDAAVRETYEETGYACRLWPLRMPTRAPPAGAAGDNSHKVQLVDGLTEPIGLTTRKLQGKLGIKTIFWYIALADNGGVEKVEGTQMANESFESVFLDADDALERLTFRNDRDIVRLATDIVRDNMERRRTTNDDVDIDI